MYTSRCRPGFTLIELIVFIVIVSVGLAGVLTVFNTVTRSSAEPVRDKQALAAAEAMLEEALNNNFANPGGGYTPAGCPATASCDRARFDDVDDYNNYGSNSAGTLCAGADIGIKDHGGNRRSARLRSDGGRRGAGGQLRRRGRLGHCGQLPCGHRQRDRLPDRQRLFSDRLQVQQ
jgi:MSHA pilin protein MshD